MAASRTTPPLRRAAVPTLLVAAVLIVVPLLDVVSSVWPLRVGEIGWRFGAVGLLSRALMMPMLGLLLVYVSALLLESHLAQRIVAFMSGAAALVLLGGAVLFVLDALQMRGQVRTEMRRPFDVASFVATFQLVIYAVILLVLAVSGWKSSRSLRRRAKRGSTRTASSVMREAGAPASALASTES